MPDTERKFHTRDANGRSVRMIDPVKLLILHRHESIDADALSAIVDTMEPGSARFRRNAWIIIPCVLAAIVLFVSFLYYSGDAGARQDLISTITNPVLMVPNIVCCCIIPWVVARQNYMKRTRSAMLQHLRCPHCGYDLRGTPTGDDGITSCSECGCAWPPLDTASAEALAADQIRLAGQRKRMFVLTLIGLTLFLILGGFYFIRSG